MIGAMWKATVLLVLLVLSPGGDGLFRSIYRNVPVSAPQKGDARQPLVLTPYVEAGKLSEGSTCVDSSGHPRFIDERLEPREVKSLPTKRVTEPINSSPRISKAPGKRDCLSQRSFPSARQIHFKRGPCGSRQCWEKSNIQLGGWGP
ncbi:PREDICTED: probable serine carboxypeptidase CPVL isoform X2 [Hipposideros armiger]|nr:PREDICTED: probable serine carboxypeptidase CPVL isoform X2 [Hipposideros armiger]